MDIYDLNRCSFIVGSLVEIMYEILSFSIYAENI